jgi:2-polyprenyl-3-methyl-5-hydroxy-6-metoxy-1,4-benzoquinol methylase
MKTKSPIKQGGTSIPRSRKGRCPVCDSEMVTLRGGGGIPTQEKTDSFLFVQNEYQIFECKACGLVFKDSILDSQQCSLLYADMDFKRWEIDSLFPTERFVVQYLKTLPRGSRILDFGCSSGRLMSNLVNLHECFGFEINRDAARKAEARGIKIIASREGLTEHAGIMDAVVLMDVFEHLENPLEVLGNLVLLLKRGGILILVTGDADCWAGRADLANFWYFRTIQHFAMMTRKHAEYIAKHCGLALRTWKTLSHYDVSLSQKSVQYLRQWVYSQVDRRPESFVSNLLKTLPIIKRCANWKIPPPCTASKDHVVVVFGRTGLELQR